MMITFRCTRKLLEYLEVDPIDEPSQSTGRLGDWYANLVPTFGGDLIVFVNERSLVTVAIPALEGDHLVSLFRARVRNLLLMLDVSRQAIEEEVGEYEEVQFAKTASRSILGSMNDIASNYQFISERGDESGILSLSDTEYKLSNMPSIARGLFPADAAKKLLEPEVLNTGAS